MDWEASSKYRSNCEPCSWQFPDILQSCSYELLSLRVAKRVPRVGADDARVYVSHVENVEITRFRSKWDGGTHVAFYIGNEAIKQKTKPLSPKIDLSYCFVTASSFSRCILVLTFCFFVFFPPSSFLSSFQSQFFSSLFVFPVFFWICFCWWSSTRTKRRPWPFPPFLSLSSFLFRCSSSPLPFYTDPDMSAGGQKKKLEDQNWSHSHYPLPLAHQIALEFSELLTCMLDLIQE